MKRTDFMKTLGLGAFAVVVPTRAVAEVVTVPDCHRCVGGVPDVRPELYDAARGGPRALCLTCHSVYDGMWT